MRCWPFPLVGRALPLFGTQNITLLLIGALLAFLWSAVPFPLIGTQNTTLILIGALLAFPLVGRVLPLIGSRKSTTTK